MTIENTLGLENTYASNLDGLFAPIDPAGFPHPELLLLNRSLATELGLAPDWLEAYGAALLSGSDVADGTRPIAQAYAGHQFGQFNPQLGDGRALLLGEVVDPRGRRFDLQLKGAGRTPFSRQGDGRAALDSALREYVVSEAMHALGVPTTRALAVVATGETVMRQRAAPGAVLTRVAASHIRIGTLEYFAARRDTDKLRRLIDYTLQRHYPDRTDTDNSARALLEAVAAAQGRLIARWMHIGFVHGVMNTDNVTLSGETIDYGPCAFMEAFDPNTVFSGIDQHGRYAYGNQPDIGAWNLARMAEALIELLAEESEAAIEIAKGALEIYGRTINAAWFEGMRAKLGLAEEREGDPELIQELLDWMKDNQADYTSTFRKLSVSLTDAAPAFDAPGFVAWDQKWRDRLGDTPLASVAQAMDAVNPLYIPRNHKVEEALDAALQGDLAPTRTLLEVVSQPFVAQPGRDTFAAPAPDAFGPYQTHCNT